MKNDAKESPEAAVRQLGKLIEGIRSATLVSLTREGSMHARPMATQQSDFAGTLWFLTRQSTGKVNEILAHEQVCLCYNSPEDQRFVSVYGRAHVRQDSEKVREIWTPLHKAWFPKGPDDPEVRLIEVEVESAEYWDTSSNAMVQILGLAKAMLTGKEAEGMGRHGQVTLPH